MPFHVTNLLLRVQMITIQDLPQWFICVIHVLVVVYPSLSPCIFAFRCKKLQRELKKMMKIGEANNDDNFPPGIGKSNF